MQIRMKRQKVEKSTMGVFGGNLPSTKLTIGYFLEFSVLEIIKTL